MNFPFLLTPLLLLQSPDALRFRPLEPNNVEVLATLSAREQKLLPQGKLTSEQGEAWLRLTLVDARTAKPGPAMLGNYQRLGPDLVFKPRYGVEPGQLYLATFGPASGGPATGRC